MKINGLNDDLILEMDSEEFTEICPKFDFTIIFLSLIISEETVTRLSMEHSIAFVPCTTKCSPKRMTFPGAEAVDFKKKLSTHILLQNSFLQ